MTNTEYIRLHLDEDVHSLALKKVPEGVNVSFCLQQIEGFQLARKKIPQWTETEGVLYPPRLSMEQCSSQLTALYKRKIVERLLPKEERLKMVDLTGGYGVDFSYLAPTFEQAIYVEKMPHLCELARHNFPILGLSNIEIICEDGAEFLKGTNDFFSLCYLDPARRDNLGRKMVALKDCTPDITKLTEEFVYRSQVTLVKLSPMLDISLAKQSLKGISEIHVVSVEGECKELLLVISSETVTEIKFHCINLGSDDPDFICSETEKHVLPNILSEIPDDESFLYEPNASILKAGAQDALCSRYHLKKLHPNSHLFVCKQFLKGFPGRSFRIIGWSDFSKQSLRVLLGDIQQANLTTRNFPTSVADLRKQLKLREGGQDYLFATTLANGNHILIRGKKVSSI